MKLSLVRSVALGAILAGCSLFRGPAVKNALDATELACVFNSTVVNADELARICQVTDALVPVLRNLIGQREGARRAGVTWPSADAGASDAGGAGGDR